MNEEKLSFWNFFIKKKAISLLLIFFIVLMGAITLFSIPRDIQPQVKIPLATITTVLPGANPTDTESLITKPLEKEISNQSSIKKVSSTSGIGLSIIIIEFENDTDLTKATQDIKDKVDLAKNLLPSEAEDPIVTQIETDTIAAISFSVTGKKTVPELTEIAEELQDNLLKIEGVAKVNILGNQNKIIEISIDQTKAKNYGLNIQNIADLIRFSGPNMPVGIITTDNTNYSVRIDNKYKSMEELRNLPLFALPDENHTIIQLSDIATVKETYPTREIKSKLSINGKKSNETVTLQVFKKENSNVLKLVDEAKLEVEAFEQNLPEDIKIAISNDNSVFIRTDLGILTSSGLQTTIFITIILFLALGFIEGFIAGLTIPLALLFAVIFMDLMGLTINSLTLFSLVIALGLMVDTAIVIMEGIHLNMKNGMSSTDAAIESIRQYKWPLIAGTFTTIFAFFPMLLVQGLVGEFLRSMPLTISAALFGSLFISLTIGPSLTAMLLKKFKVNEKASILEPLFNHLGEIFHIIIHFIVGRTSAKIMVIAGALVLFIGSMSLPITGLLKVEMFPATDMQFFIINIETPKGTDLKTTENVAASVETILYQIPEIDNFLTTIGSSQSIAPSDLVEVGGTSEPNQANITVNLLQKDERERKSYSIAEEIRQKVVTIPNAEIEIKELREGPPGDAPITVKIAGENINTLKSIAKDIEKVIAEVPGTQNIQISLKPGINEIRFTLDPNKLAYHGLNISQVSMLIRNSVQGVKATNININDKDLDVFVKYELAPGVNNMSISDIKNLEVSTPQGYTVTVGELGSDELMESLDSIQRENQKRVVKITSDLSAELSPVEANAKVADKLADYKLPSGYDIGYGGDAAEVNESFNDLYRSMIVAIILIGFTLVLMFNSLKQPLIILLTLPLAIIGVFPGLMIIGLKFSFPSFLGIVALTGVVVNDAIILIDRINQNRKEGVEFKEAIAEATKSRLHPIIITTLTTVIGILPLALTNEFWKGLGFALIFGLSAGTILTLIVIPVIYYLFEIRGEKRNKFTEMQ